MSFGGRLTVTAVLGGPSSAPPESFFSSSVEPLASTQQPTQERANMTMLPMTHSAPWAINLERCSLTTRKDTPKPNMPAARTPAAMDETFAGFDFRHRLDERQPTTATTINTKPQRKNVTSESNWYEAETGWLVSTEWKRGAVGIQNTTTCWR